MLELEQSPCQALLAGAEPRFVTYSRRGRVDCADRARMPAARTRLRRQSWRRFDTSRHCFAAGEEFGQSGTMALRRITAAQAVLSSLRCAANSSGVSNTGIKACCSSFSASAGDFIALRTSALMRRTIASGVPAGATTLNEL